jgi:hypothetical protein
LLKGKRNRRKTAATPTRRLHKETSGPITDKPGVAKPKGVRNLKLRSLEDVKRPGVKRLIEEAVELNKKDPPSGKMVGMDKRRKNENKKQ